MYGVGKEIWLPEINILRSDNFNERPHQQVDLIVIHNISLPPGEFGGSYVKDLFTNCLDCSAHATLADLEGVEVSAHFFIDRSGEVTQFVPLNYRAWHAGESCFEGVSNCNDYSVGIELEGDDHTPYTRSQYASLCRVITEVRAYFPAVTNERIVGHQHIAPGRKTDPGPAFDWDRLSKSL